MDWRLRLVTLERLVAEMIQRPTSDFKSQLRRFISGLASALLITALFVVVSDQTASAVSTSAPGRVRGVVASAANGSATISWFAPSYSGSSQISRYVASTEDGRQTCSTTGATSCTITGLTNGTPYRFVVTATSSAGTSDPVSTSRAVTPFTKASAPQTVITVPGTKSVRVSWTAPSSNGGAEIRGYVVTSSPDNKTCRANAVSACTVRGLTRGQSYIFSVTASNKAGSSQFAYSAPTSPFDLPSAPVAIQSQSQGGSINVSWLQPLSNGGAAIQRYRVTSSPPKYNCTTITTSCSFASINNGVKYTFNVIAVNAVGNSPAGNSSSSAPVLTVPSPPTSVTASPENFGALVSWAAPTSIGGSNITSYTVTSSPGGRTCTTSMTSCFVLGLNNYIFYTFSVTATNTVGISDKSQDSTQVMPGSRIINDYLVYPGANLAGAKLDGSDLSRLNLAGVNLAGANLEGANISYANLTGANLAGVIFVYANLTNANLTGANLAGANLLQANLEDARLVGATLIGANLVQTILQGTNLAGTNLSFTTLTSTNLSRTNLTGTNLTGADLSYVNFQYANLTGTNLTSCNLTGISSGSIQGTPLGLPDSWVKINGHLVGPGANLVAADLQEANLGQASLNGADLTSARLHGARLSNADLRGVKALGIIGTPADLPDEWKLVDSSLFGPGVDLSYSNLTGMNLGWVNLKGANIEGSKLDGANLVGVRSGEVSGTPLVLPAPWKLINGYLMGPGAQMSWEDLSGMNLKGVTLSGADLGGANLRGATLIEAILIGTTLSSADLTGSDLSSANMRGADLFASKLIGANLSGASLIGANLYVADLTGANLSSTNLSQANLGLVRLDDAILEGANLKGANLEGSELNGSWLFGSDLTGVRSGGIFGNPLLPYGWTLINGYLIGPGANLQGAYLDGFDLTNADLSGANLEGASLDWVDLTYVDLTGVKSGGIIGNPLLRFNWRLVNGYLIGPGANLEGAYLEGADLIRANLNDSNLMYANLSGANLKNANLNGAFLEGASFYDANLQDVIW